MQTIALIGYGKMAKAIACALNGRFALEIIGRNREKMQNFINENKLQNATICEICENGEIFLQDKIAILAIKPYALKSFRYKGKADALFSVMAGVTIARLREVLDARTFIRVMPNVASLVSKGVSAIFIDSITADYADSLESADSHKGADFVDSLKSAADSTQSPKAQCEAIFAPLGECIFVEKESLIDAAGAISGSGSAYLGLVAEAMIDAGVREGLTLEMSKRLTRGLFRGFSALFESVEASSIRTDTTSPAGTTIEALAVLENRGVRGAFLDAIHAAHDKSKRI